MPALRFSFTWTVAALAAFVARMRRAGFGITAACFAGRRLRSSRFVFGRRDPMVEVYRRRGGGLLGVSLGLLERMCAGRVVCGWRLNVHLIRCEAWKLGVSC